MSNQYLDKIQNLPDHEKKIFLGLLEEYEESKNRKDCQEDFLCFVKQSWVAFIEGYHHTKMADAFNRVSRGELKRLIINMPPRHTKSEFASYLLPAWYLGKYPDRKIIQIAHTAELAVGFGRKVRNLVGSEDFKKIFPQVALQADSKAAGRWNTNKGGEYFAIGVGGAVTGKGADVLIIDDPHSEQEGQSGDPQVFDRVYEYYTSGPRQRLQPGGSIVIVMTRWHKRDLTGQILKAQAQRKGVDEWEVIEFPAILPSGKSLWQEFWDIKELEKLKSELPVSKWSAQYQQDPTSEEGAIVKREWWQPDAFIVEGKAAGMPLIFELRQMGIPVSEYTPSRGNDKISRVNAVSDLFASGVVWAPERRFSEEVIEEFASFPSGDHDDLVDSSTQALLRFRQGGFIPLHSDEEEEELPIRRADYY